MVTANHIVIPVLIKDSKTLTKGARNLSTCCVGASVEFIFADVWQRTLPHRTAIFFAEPSLIAVPITENRAIIPPECYVPFAPLHVCVCGTDCISDDAAIARNEEIETRLKEIYSEMCDYSYSELDPLISELHALEKEQKELNLIRKRLTTEWCKVAYIHPGVHLPYEGGGI